MSNNKELIRTKSMQVSSLKPLESQSSLIADYPSQKVKVLNTISIDTSEKNTRKNNYSKSINIYPNPEQKKKNQLKPIKLNFDLVKKPMPSNKEISPRVEYYFPIIEKEKNHNKIFSQLNNNQYITKSKNDKFPKLNCLKHNLLNNNFDENYKSELNNKNNLPNFRYPLKMVEISDYINDINLKNNFLDSKINNSRELKPIKNHVLRKKDIIQQEIDRRKKLYKQQLLLRGKYQYCKKYQKCKSNVILEDNEKKLNFDNNKDIIEKNINVKQISNFGVMKERNINLEYNNEFKIFDELKKQSNYITESNNKDTAYEKLKYDLMGEAFVVLPEDIQLKAVDS